MTGRGRFVPLLLAFLMLAGSLAAALHGAVTAPRPGHAAPTGPHRPALQGVPRPAPDTDDRTDAWLATALARPLFDPARRLAGEAAAAPVAALPRLTGVVVGASGSAAIFERPGGGKALAVRAGDRLDDYVVHSIVPGEATLLGPGGRIVLRPAVAPADRSAPARSGDVPG